MYRNHHSHCQNVDGLIFVFLMTSIYSTIGTVETSIVTSVKTYTFTIIPIETFLYTMSSTATSLVVVATSITFSFYQDVYHVKFFI